MSIELRILEKKVNKYENSGLHHKPEMVLQFRTVLGRNSISNSTHVSEWKDVPIVKEGEE